MRRVLMRILKGMLTIVFQNAPQVERIQDETLDGPSVCPTVQRKE
jgi:hypothetical protein